MIKIVLTNTASILNSHYLNLTTKKKQEWTIINFLENRKKINTLKKVKDFYDYLLAAVELPPNSTDFNDSILTGTPQVLDKFAEETEVKYRQILNREISKDYTIRQDLKKVFYYDKYDKWGPYSLAKKIKISVCPYCNRNYTFTIGDDSAKKTRFEYDHFMNKAKFPYLGLSFYNLIPSCHVCNSNLKKDADFTINNSIHPYLEGFGDEFRFHININSIEFISGISSTYEIDLKPRLNGIWSKQKIEAAKKNTDIFQLKELYNLHQDYVDEIIIKKKIYSEEYLNSLYDQFGDNLFESKNEVKRIAFGNYFRPEDQGKRVLAKLTGDILEDLETKTIIY